jgi:Protein of unknown function (DUF229)
MTCHCVFFCVSKIRWIDDNTADYGPAVTFTEDIRPEVDFMRVRCYRGDPESARRVYTNFHALVRRKIDVERRCDKKTDEFLKKTSRSTDDLWNVLMIGIDSTSRLNSIRRLKSTRRFLLHQLRVRSKLISMHSCVRVRVHVQIHLHIGVSALCTKARQSPYPYACEL